MKTVKIFFINGLLVFSATPLQYSQAKIMDFDRKSLMDIIQEKPLQVNKPKTSSRDVVCHATNIYHESRNQSVRGQKLVFEVVENRKAQKKNSACAVVYAQSQFSWTLDSSKKIKDWKTFNAIKKRVEYWSLTSTPSVRGIDHYHRYDINPKWNRSMKRVVRVDDHVFFRSQLF